MTTPNQDYINAFKFDFYVKVGRHLKQYCHDSAKMNAFEAYAEEIDDKQMKRILKNIKSLCDKGYMDECKGVYDDYNLAKNAHNFNLSKMVKENTPPEEEPENV